MNKAYQILFVHIVVAMQISLNPCRCNSPLRCAVNQHNCALSILRWGLINRLADSGCWDPADPYNCFEYMCAVFSGGRFNNLMTTARNYGTVSVWIQATSFQIPLSSPPQYTRQKNAKISLCLRRWCAEQRFDFEPTWHSFKDSDIRFKFVINAVALLQ